MARLTKENVDRARATIALYPQMRSAMIPLLHLVQEQDGYVTRDGMEHVAELLELTPAEVYGTASFYEMFKMHPTGRYLVNVCTNISCMLVGGYELLAHLEERLGVSAGATTADGMFTLEEVECIAACTDAPCLLVNYRTFGPLTNRDADTLIDDLAAGRLAETVPVHGVTNRVKTRRFSATPGAAPAAAGTAALDAEGAASPPGPGATEPQSKDETSPTRKPEPGR
ncbi:MAG TPA: NAD(P)H-dependent oxidoreductase subunit E [Acidimicrobiales bacterium]